ncbi:MAG: hypothetical protein ABSF37_07400 [Sedimentisphaerales bacterium]|jgi:hypothetical protein
MRESFEEHIKGLNAEFVAMGEMVAMATSRSIEAIVRPLIFLPQMA